MTWAESTHAGPIEGAAHHDTWAGSVVRPTRALARSWVEVRLGLGDLEAGAQSTGSGALTPSMQVRSYRSQLAGEAEDAAGRLGLRHAEAELGCGTWHRREEAREEAPGHQLGRRLRGRALG